MIPKSYKQADLVSHIAGFTSLRDADLLELSLLKSVYTTLKPVNVSLVSIDSSNIVLKRIDYSADQYGHITTKVPADKHLLRASEQLDKTQKKYCSVSFDQKTLTIFVLSQSRHISNYILIESLDNIITQTDSHQIIGMLQVFQNFRSLLSEAQTDELTGLPNRKLFNTVISRISDTIQPSPEKTENDRRKSANTDKQYWLALVDLDNFKGINDNFGHVMGDEVLVRVAQTMQSSLRDSDMVFRYGGEEFATIICADDKTQAEITFERLRVDIEKLSIPAVGTITVSVGAIRMRNDVFHLTLIDSADKALYESKSSGKNCVTFAPDESSPKALATEGDIELF